MTRYVRVRKSICYEVKATKKKCIYQLLCSISSSFQKLNQEISISKITTKNVARKFSKLKKNGYPFSKIHFKGSKDNKYKKPDSNRVASQRSPYEKIIKNFFYKKKRTQNCPPLQFWQILKSVKTCIEHQLCSFYKKHSQN